MAYDPVSAAMRGLGGSLERLGGNISQSISERSGRGLEEMKLNRLYQNDQQAQKLRDLQIESATMGLEKQKQDIATDAQPFSISEWVDDNIKKATPVNMGMTAGDMGGPPGAYGAEGKPSDVGSQQAIFGFKKWAAKQLPSVIKSVFGGDVEIRQDEGGPTLYSKSQGRVLTRGDIKKMGDFEERMGAAIGGLTHGEKLLQLLAGAGDSQAIKSLKEYDTEEGKLRRYQYELGRKMELKSLAGAKGWDTSTIDTGIKYTQGKIDKIVTKMETPYTPMTRKEQISFERDKKAATAGFESYKAVTREQKIQDAADIAKAKRGPKESPYNKLSRNRDENNWNKAKDIIEAWESDEKIVLKDGSEVVAFVDSKGVDRITTMEEYEKSLKIYDELDRKFKGNPPLFKRVSEEGPFVRKQITRKKSTVKLSDPLGIR